MVSGHLAARSAAAGTTERYERSWRAEIGAELRDAVLVQRHLLTTPERIDALVDAARRAPGVADLLIRYAMGEVSYFAGAAAGAPARSAARASSVCRRTDQRMAHRVGPVFRTHHMIDTPEITRTVAHDS